MKFIPHILVALAAFMVTTSASAAVGEGARPLLVIRFNQERVYYQRALKQAVTSAEQAKSGVRYHVVSSVPTGARKDAMKPSAEQAKANLDQVMTLIAQLGVSKDRVSVENKSSATAASQEIRLFVE